MKTDNEVRCSSPAVSYGKVLFGMNIPEGAVDKTREILREVPQLTDLFMNPTIPLKTKCSVADKVFPNEMRNFMKTVCRYQKMGLIGEIFAAYDRCREKQAGIRNAVLYCVTPPGEEQKKGIEAFICRKYGAKEAKLSVCRDDSLMGGFLLRVGSDEYDWSVKSRMDRLAQELGCDNTLTWR